MIVLPDPPSFERMLRDTVRTRLGEIVAEETATLGKRLEDEARQARARIVARIAAEADTIALRILRSYDLQHQHGRLIITVRKELPDGGAT